MKSSGTSIITISRKGLYQNIVFFLVFGIAILLNAIFPYLVSLKVDSVIFYIISALQVYGISIGMMYLLHLWRKRQIHVILVILLEIVAGVGAFVALVYRSEIYYGFEYENYFFTSVIVLSSVFATYLLILFRTDYSEDKSLYLSLFGPIVVTYYVFIFSLKLMVYLFHLLNLWTDEVRDYESRSRGFPTLDESALRTGYIKDDRFFVDSYGREHSMIDYNYHDGSFKDENGYTYEKSTYGDYHVSE